MAKIGVLTSGGDSPGMNAVIRAVTRSALFRGVEVIGIKDGYSGLMKEDFISLDRSAVSDIIFRGGTILGSARLPEFKEEMIQKRAAEILKKNQIDSLVVIGGDGSYRGAMALTKLGIKCIGIPGTIDNDIVSTDFTIGFDTALKTIVDAVDKLRDTSSSHHRCSVVEVMGNRCGDLALYAGISCGAELVITPESGFDEKESLEQLSYLDLVKRKKHAIVLISEKITDVEVFASKISDYTTFSGRATVLGHIQRGGSPSVMDRVLASKMGDKAVELLVQGEGGYAIGIINNELVATPIDVAVNMSKKSRKSLYDLHTRLV